MLSSIYWKGPSPGQCPKSSDVNSFRESDLSAGSFSLQKSCKREAGLSSLWCDVSVNSGRGLRAGTYLVEPMSLLDQKHKLLERPARKTIGFVPPNERDTSLQMMSSYAEAAYSNSEAGTLRMNLEHRSSSKSGPGVTFLVSLMI